MRSTKDEIKGLYVIKNKGTGERYVGRSCDVFRRLGEHQRDVQSNEDKKKKTVGGFISSMDKMEFCVLELSSDTSEFDMRFYEQHLLMKVRSEGGKVKNRINAMRPDVYNPHKAELQLE